MKGFAATGEISGSSGEIGVPGISLAFEPGTRPRKAPCRGTARGAPTLLFQKKKDVDFKGGVFDRESVSD